MKKMFLLLFSIFSCNLSAQNTFYVSDTNGNNSFAGSQTNPWKTIQYGVNQLSAGDILIVEGGIYPEIVTFSGSSNSGSPDNPITIKSNRNVIIDGSSLTPNGRKGLITISGASNLIIDGFELQNYQTPNPVADDNNTPIGILVEGTCKNLTIKNNKIHDIKNFSSCTQNSGCGPGANGIAVYGDTIGGIQNIELLNNEVYQCVTSSSESFTLNGNINGFKVIDNYVHDNNNIGFDFIGFEDDVCSACGDDNQARNGLVKGNRAIGNTIFGNNSLGIPANPWYQSEINANEGNAGGFYVDGGRNIIFDGNLSSENDLGFEFGSENQFRETSDILMINNYVYNNKENGVIVGGYSQTEDDPDGGGGDALRIYIYNNSFYKNKGWGSEIVFQNRVKESRVANNIFFGENTTSDCYENFNPGSNSNNFWGTNLWWGTSVSGSVPGTSIMQNPNFVSPDTGDLDIQASSTDAIDTGIIQSDITTWTDPFWDTNFPPDGVISAHGTTDYRNNNRFINGLDIGAFELDNTLGIQDKPEEPSLMTYPNPVQNIIYFSITGKNYNYAIYDMSGKKLSQGKAADKISVSNLTPGIYILSLEDDTSKWSYKFVKVQ
ncbi:T9SS type A sorting domain-containing protein [Aquimarina sp. 2201CG5-10]|uniref:T9SS type A sorting domain-containing protein n=1 Tax=Aquimarina callyspongiae TaxID=3098150 RepID=UPI002AB47376|nr:T9SS type A sorting domain-containing protein [Aquimarina sp. 2201CG5-10]MDY8137300.1 T9SS type A sorting domain-containing protein [Aquimarina sp. 2201CG5-10]